MMPLTAYNLHTAVKVDFVLASKPLHYNISMYNYYLYEFSQVCDDAINCVQFTHSRKGRLCFGFQTTGL